MRWPIAALMIPGLCLYPAAGAGLAVRRLALVDLITGAQPISNEDETLDLVTNGEIYNHRELRRELEQRGHRFRTSTDVEVILHLYEDLGTNCFQRLNGMFAAAILDNRTGTVVLVRDRCGMKPLYYAETRAGFLFASEPGPSSPLNCWNGRRTGKVWISTWPSATRRRRGPVSAASVSSRPALPHGRAGRRARGNLLEPGVPQERAAPR